jgi:hypothetical protein
MTRSMLTLGALVALLAAPAAAQAQPADNAIQPSPVFFGEVKAGDHPKKLLTLTNHTGRKQTLRKFILEGAGGGKFGLGVGDGATCRRWMNLKNGRSCTFYVRVVTDFPDWWETNIQINYGPRIMGLPKRGQWNAIVFAHVVAR